MKKMENKKVTAVIVTYESRETIGLALDTLHPSYQAGFAECVVVDNASTDGTADFVANEYPWVSLIAGTKNIGYGRGCNLGLEATETPYVLFMNPDVQIKQEALEHLLQFAEAHPQAGLIGPAIKRQNGDYQQAGCLPTPITFLRQAMGLRGTSTRTIHPGDTPFVTNWVCGAVMLAPTQVVRELAGFDPRFFLYYEETDLCVRMAKAGYTLWAVPTAETAHASNASARKVRPELKVGGCLEEHFFPSRYYYLAKHYGLLSAFFTELFELVIFGIRDLSHFCLGRKCPHQFRARLRNPHFVFPDKLPHS